ncbi:MAG: PadR family transcriptional regulator [Desulfobacterales bacterium]|nr:PadR family transcriptional regulator [Desulfobacterales bacterium]
MKTRLATEYIVLGSLMSGPKHGYEIMQFLDADLGFTWHVSTSQVYTLLKRLEQKGLLNFNLKNQESRPSKRVFSLTSTGEKAFLDWLHSPTENIRDIRIEFLAKLFFFHHLSLKGGDNLINVQIQNLRQLREKMQQDYQVEKDSYNTLVLSFKKATLETWLEWLQKEAIPFIRNEGTKCL